MKVKSVDITQKKVKLKIKLIITATVQTNSFSHKFHSLPSHKESRCAVGFDSKEGYSSSTYHE